jgi:Xaa-Pro aminopeptidase
MTVEPGLYIPAGTKGVAQKWWNIGIRIEDDVLVTKDGCEVLTRDVPKEPDEIEALMAGGSVAKSAAKKAAERSQSRGGKRAS